MPIIGAGEAFFLHYLGPGSYHAFRYLRVWSRDINVCRAAFFSHFITYFSVARLPSLSVYLYLIDAFVFPASAIAAAALFESLLAFTIPLFGQDMYVKLGFRGGNSLLAGLAIIIGIPFPIWIWYKGEDIRRKSPITS
jgi:hypothetical protein